MKKNNRNNIGKVVATLAGVAALSAAGYILFGPDGKKNRNKIRGWAVKMKGEMIEKLEEAKEITEPIYDRIVDEVSKKYAEAKNIDKAELAAVVNGLRKQWKNISAAGKAKVRSAVKKTAKKAVRKPAPKKKTSRNKRG